MNEFQAIIQRIQAKYGYEMTEPLSPEEYEQKKVDLYNQSTGNLNEVDGYNCDLCKNKGYIARVDERGYQIYSYCRCQKVRNTLRRAQRSGLGDVLKDCTFDKYIVADEWQKVIKEKAQAFCRDDAAKWFFIGGQVGCGKSHICTAIAGHYIKAEKNTVYMLWCDESKKLKSLITDYAAYQELIEKYKNADVLYIDDLFKVKAGEQPTTADINLAFEILNARLLSRNKITIISSEKTMMDMLEYDEGTMSRIFQQAGVYKINVGKDIKKNYRLRDMETL